jgi:hypothetical protein
MIARFSTAQTPSASGWQVYVTLNLSDEEHTLIYENRMSLSGEGTLKIADYDDRALYFGDFYGRTHTTVWDFNSSYQANLFIEQLNRTLNGTQRGSLNWFFAENRKHPGFKDQVVWNFFDQERFSHTWIVAGTGSGKTTLLSALIQTDLDKVARGDSSVLVLDSQNEHLSRYLPRHPRFAPGGDLHGTLIYIEPDLAHPLALNVYDFANYRRLDENEQMAQLRTVEHMLTFFIGANIGGISGHMVNIVRYSLQALAHIPHATVYTFRDLISNKEKASDLINALPLDQDTREFLTTGMFSRNYAATLDALASRLQTFSSDKFFAATFKHPNNKLDLYELLKSARVIVINTNTKRLGEATPIFGRFFLAQLLRVARRRTDDAAKLPVYVFVDEAQEYIAEEPAVVALIQEARRQNMGFTFCHHSRSDITLDSVREALRNCAVHIEPSPQRYHWAIRIRHSEAVTINSPEIDFSRQQMSRPDFQAILDDMHRRFSYAPEPPTNPLPPPSHNADDDATTER